MAFEYLAQIPSWVASFNWSNTTDPGTTLYTAVLNPLVLRAPDSTVTFNTSNTFEVRNYFPAAYIANLFNYWRGDFVFTFKIVKT